MIFAAISFSNASSIKEKEVKNLSTYLNNRIGFPEVAQERGIEGTVTLIVRVDENQKLKVSNIKGTCCEFEDYIVEYFNKLEQRPVRFSKEIGTKKLIVNFNLL